VNLFTNPIGVVAPVGAAPPATVTANQNADAALALWESTLAATLAGTINDSVALGLPSGPAAMTDMVFDPATQSFMLEMIDALTGNVISEAPIGAQLQFQALAQLMAGASTAAQAQASGAINIQA
jgi:hypothetical protein